MYVFETIGAEGHPIYETLSAENLLRQYDFLRSVVKAAVALDRPMLSLEVVKALNYHAIAALHPYAGVFRPCYVQVGQGENAYVPPQYFQVPAQMEMFVDEVNRKWDTVDPVILCAYVLWKLNSIHPFVNGNGRTARAAAYYVLCLKVGGLLPGDPILPALIKENRQEYVEALKSADASLKSGSLNLGVLHAFLLRLLQQQIASAQTTNSSKQSGNQKSPPQNDGGVDNVQGE